MPRTNSLAFKVRDRLAASYDRLKERFERSPVGQSLCNEISDQRDEALRDLWEDVGTSHDLDGWSAGKADVALVALGGTGRRDTAPFSDVDLMILYGSNAGQGLESATKQFVRNVFDSGMQLGHSVRTIRQACSLAKQDAQIRTSLVDARWLAGAKGVFEKFQRQFDRTFRPRVGAPLSDILHERNGERIRYGDSVYLLEPNIKRSSGGLRDLQLLRWIGKLRYGGRTFDALYLDGLLDQRELIALREAEEFLLKLRNALHFTSGKADDVLDRMNQRRIAEQWGFAPRTGILPVERFMREYFRHTTAVRHIVHRFCEKAQASSRWKERLAIIFGHRTVDGFHVGPNYVVASRKAVDTAKRDWGVALAMADLANLHGKDVHPDSWDAVQYAAQGELAKCSPDTLPTARAVKHFRSFMQHTGNTGTLLRELHERFFLERMIPQFTHARGLLQYNQYHKYTVDEHSIRAVEHAAALLHEEGPVGRVYRKIDRRELLHVALLIHDLGKGYPEEHLATGARFAEQIAERLGYSEEETDTLRFLVLNHDAMNRLAFRRDTSDEALIVRFAVDVKSPERLRMLYVMTACDLAAVGPDVWDDWKSVILTDLYHRTMRHVAGDADLDEETVRLQEAVQKALDEAKQDETTLSIRDQVRRLPPSVLRSHSPEELILGLRLLHELGDRPARVHFDYREETGILALTVATHESAAKGIFHRLTGALAQKGLLVLGAEIHTFDRGGILDRFTLRDPDFRSGPTGDRLQEIEEAVLQMLVSERDAAPPARKTWRSQHQAAPVEAAKTAVQVDNRSSADYTILDVFTTDQPGLLHCIAKTLFELHVSIARARVATFDDQVVDVFYVTELDGRKIESDLRIQQLRLRLVQEILKRGSQTPG